MNTYEATCRDFILQDASHNKFWRYWIFDKQGIWIAQYGRIGTVGQRKIHRYTHNAWTDAKEKGYEKINKGYQGGPVVEIDVRSIYAVHDLPACDLDNAWLRRAKRDTHVPTRENEDVKLAVKDLLSLDKMLEGLS